VTDDQLPASMLEDLAAFELAQTQFEQQFGSQACKRWEGLGANTTDDLDTQRREVTARRDDEAVWAALAWETERRIELMVEVRQAARSATRNELHK
jgi:hypothetical protein